MSDGVSPPQSLLSRDAEPDGRYGNATKNPDKILEIQRALQEGDLGAVYSRIRRKPDDLGAAVVHIFRFQDNRIAELWDIGQQAPENSPNEYGMF
jgi:predicted SnoaL-like aldol condensation-catalyzing enzyme